MVLQKGLNDVVGFTIMTSIIISMLSWCGISYAANIASLTEVHLSFDFDTDIQGWNVNAACASGLTAEQGNLKTQINDTTDPYIYIIGVNNLHCDKTKAIEIRVLSKTVQSYKLYFATSVNPDFSEQATLSVNTIPSENFETITFDLSDMPNWEGNITAIRFDLDGGKVGDDVLFDYIRLGATNETLVKTELNNRLKNAVVLAVGNSNALVNNKKVKIDDNNIQVKPIIINERTLLPVRFVAENLGANVSWSDIDSTCEVSLNDKSVKMRVDADYILVNDIPVPSEVSVQILNDRIFVPLRVLAEMLGKKIFWNERGIIVISEQDNIIDNRETALLDLLKKSFDNMKAFDYDVLLAKTDGRARPYFPDITKCDNNDILAAYYWNTVHVGSDKGEIRTVKSKDNGKTWSEPKTAFDLRPDMDTRDPHIGKLSDGTLILCFFTYNFGEVQAVGDIYISKSADNGETWSEPKAIIEKSAVSSPIIETKSGELVIAYYRFDEKGIFYSCISKSKDKGETWSDELVILKGENACEPAIVELGNTLYVLIRDQGWLYSSEDNGHTWNFIAKAGKIHAPHFLKIDEENAFVTWCTPGAVNGNRAVYGQIFNSAKGWEKDNAKLIYSSPGTGISDMGYPGSVQTDSKTFLTIYYDTFKEITAGTFTKVSDWD